MCCLIYFYIPIYLFCFTLFYRHYAHRRKAVSLFYLLCRQTYYIAFRRRYCLLVSRVRNHIFSNHTKLPQTPLSILQVRFVLFHNGQFCIIRCGFFYLFSRCYDLHGFGCSPSIRTFNISNGTTCNSKFHYRVLSF